MISIKLKNVKDLFKNTNQKSIGDDNIEFNNINQDDDNDNRDSNILNEFFQ